MLYPKSDKVPAHWSCWTWVPQYMCIPHPRELNDEMLNQQTREGLAVHEHPVRVHPTNRHHIERSPRRAQPTGARPRERARLLQLASRASSTSKLYQRARLASSPTVSSPGERARPVSSPYRGPSYLELTPAYTFRHAHHLHCDWTTSPFSRATSLELLPSLIRHDGLATVRQSTTNASPNQPSIPPLISSL